MTEREFSKLDIAREYLDAAIEFVLARQNFFCATHLSAAAEELFGAHISESQRISTVAWKAEKALVAEAGKIPSDATARKSVNEWKNEIKHMDGDANRMLKIDPAFAAEHHIEHALNNFYKLRLRKSAAIWKFEEHQTRRTKAIS